LILGYDPREFWPVSGGSLGTARETEQQHRKAATKGSLEVPHAWQERFQQLLPETLHFQFEQRDTESEIIDAEMAQVYTEIANALYSAGEGEGGLLEREQALQMLVEKGIIPPEWTESQETTIMSDEKTLRRMKERIRASSEMQRLAEKQPKEPIIIYRWSGTGATETVLWDEAEQVTKRRWR
jgi:hypothetical protein